MGYVMKHAYNGWAALAAVVLAGCSDATRSQFHEPDAAVELDRLTEQENRAIVAKVRRTFAVTQRVAIELPHASPPPAPTELDPSYTGDSLAQASVYAVHSPTQVVGAVGSVSEPPSLVSRLVRMRDVPPVRRVPVPAPNSNPAARAASSPAPAASLTPRSFDQERVLQTIVSAEGGIAAPLTGTASPVNVEEKPDRAAATDPFTLAVLNAAASAGAIQRPEPPGPRNAGGQGMVPQASAQARLDQAPPVAVSDPKAAPSQSLRRITLRTPPTPAFLSAPDTLRSVTIDRHGNVTAWEPVTGPSRARGLIRKSIVAAPAAGGLATDDGSGADPRTRTARIELIAEPNPGARSEAEHSGLIFTALADGSLVYTCE